MCAVCVCALMRCAWPRGLFFCRVSKFKSCCNVVWRVAYRYVLGACRWRCRTRRGRAARGGAGRAPARRLRFTQRPESETKLCALHCIRNLLCGTKKHNVTVTSGEVACLKNSRQRRVRPLAVRESKIK